MAKCIKHNRDLFITADDEIKHCLEVFLPHLGREKSIRPHPIMFSSGGNYRKFLDRGLASINEQPERDELYYAAILSEMAQLRSSPLSSLKQDNIQCIASFAVLTENRLALLRTAKTKFLLATDIDNPRGIGK